ncbi:hypothetical protein HHI36_016454 [Cryptolaemus montrouzieri]|uniref:Uncharacterized protein n=1 Tax=Cryptolaemus montrouzieri TaxID=559131 RepID=A0ABD2NKN3_9CUCU
MNCIVLSETWVVDNVEVFNLSGYRLIYNEGSFNKTDRLIVYVKKNLQFTQRVVDISEVKALEININFNNTKIRILAAYRNQSVRERQKLNQQKQRRSGKKLNTNPLKKLLSDTDWNLLNREKNINYKTNLFTTKIKKCVEEATSTFIIPKGKVKRKTWITASLVRSIKKKNHMYKSLLRNPEQEDLRSEYKRYRNTLTDVINEAKNRYFSDKIENNRGNSKKIYEDVGVAIRVESGSREEIKKHEMVQQGDQKYRTYFLRLQ